ncbi:phosphohydrolase [Ureaplasma diversum]|uniref:Phosphohydrolase n=1 Tax=Ureaplasma diversum TaxID=42094 RepID=A0A0C5RLQ9_9BACT|nr:HD domain-containing protein [Ureaplasma diversum]AJQ45638.1 phosphohydrolase [Ureaplasma diversum]
MEFKKRFFIKDPIHGLITFDQEYSWAAEIINSKEFWRLHQIKQLGLAWTVFPSATHTRFVHCIGVFEVARKIVANLEFYDSDQSNLAYEKKVVCAAALLHDIGHGPYSHTFEEATNYNHEKAGVGIIVDPNSQINQILLKHQINPIDVANVINHVSNKEWMHQIISSQIDADRLDYLPRDSHFSGAKYGTLEYDMIFTKLVVYQEKLYFSKYSWNALENILLARNAMFQNVYWNRNTITYDLLMRKTLKRVYDLYKQNYQFKTSLVTELLTPWFLNSEWTSEYVAKLTDFSFNSMMEQLVNEDDQIIAKLASNWLRNQEFETILYEVSSDQIPENNLSDYFNETIIFAQHKHIYDFNKPVMLYSYNELNKEFITEKLEDRSISIRALKNVRNSKYKCFVFRLKQNKK